MLGAPLAAHFPEASERRFRESMEHSPIGMLIASLDSVWGYTNIALQQMLGYTAEEFRALPPGGRFQVRGVGRRVRRVGGSC